MNDKGLAPGARHRSGWAGVAGVAVSLGLTELMAGLSSAVPSAIAAIGAYIIDASPPWLKTFAISTFGTADKAVLGIGIFLVALLIGWLAGRAASRRPVPIIVAFGTAAVVGIVAQLTQPGAVTVFVVASTSASMGVGLLTWHGIVVWARPRRSGAVESSPTDFDRRRLLIGVGAAIVVSVVAVGMGRSMLRSRAEAQRGALILPEPIERVIDPETTNDFTLDLLTPIVVANAAFYRIDTALVVPAVDPEEWTLTITGMVDRDVVLTYADIMAMPLVERYVTLSCVSNEVGGGLVGNALWTGVPLPELLDLAGVQGDADQIVARSIDGWSAGFPTDIAFDGRNALLAVGMNREVLPANHGFPARLVVPGLYGYVSATKWITEIELTTWDAFDGYWIPRGWSKEGPIKTQSRIDRPRNRSKIDAGAYTFGGIAWAPTVGIAGVELQIDDGPWRPCELSEALSDEAWVQWKLDADVAEGDHLIRVRAIDGSGFTQTRPEVAPAPSGAEGWHTINIKATRT